MPYFPVSPQTDDRRAKGITPTRLRNCYVDTTPKSAINKRSSYVIVPSPGRTRVATLGANLRGVFAQDGVVGGALFAANGSTLNSVSDAWAVSSVGTIFGGDVVSFAGLRDKLVMRAYQSIHYWDGATFSTVVDADAPTIPVTLAVVGLRVVAAEDGGDTFSWSKAGLPGDWDAAGLAADVDVPDPIVGQFEIGGDLWNGNSTSFQIWRATGGSEAEAFVPLEGVNIRKGLLARDSFARVGDGSAMFLGNDRVVYRVAGYGVQPVPNRDLEDVLAGMTQANLEASLGWSYTDGSKEFYGLKLQGVERAFVYDVALGLFHERTRYEASEYDVDFVTGAYNEAICASADAAYLWRLDKDVYTDDGTLIQRQMTIAVPVAGGTSIDRIVLDAEFYDQPLSGQGSAPTMILDFSMDGGRTFAVDAGTQRTVDLPARGVYNKRVQAFRFGRVVSEKGFILRLTITDPIGFSIYGLWVNPPPEEVY